MKGSLVLLLAVALCCPAFAQFTNIQWQKSLGGSGSDGAYAIRQTFDGGYIVNGMSTSADGEVTGHHGTATSYDYWMVKLDDTGAIQWEKSLGGTQDDQGHAVLQTLDSGYVVAGGIESSDGDVTGCTVAEWDYWLVKLSATGAIEWNTCFGGSGYNMAWSVEQAPEFNLIVAGVTYSTDGDVVGNHGMADYWVLSVTAAGTMVWQKCLGGSGTDQGKMAQPTADGGYIVVGYSNSTDGQVTGNHGQSDYWVVKLDDTGAVQWQKSLGGSSIDEGYAIQQTFDGGYIVAGSSNSNDGQVSGHHGDSTTYDYWVVKLDDTGAIQWQRSLGGSGNDNAYSVQQTSDSGYIVSGSSTSSDGDVTVNLGGQDYWVVKLSKFGNIQWQKSFGGSNDDYSYSVQQTADTGFIAAGASGSTDGNVTGNHGASDYWVVKLSPCLDSPSISRVGTSFSTSTGYNTYQWYYNGSPISGATGATYTDTSVGSYYVTVSDTNGCSGSSNTIIIPPVGVQMIGYNPRILLMPNPTTGAFNIKGTEFAQVQVYDVVGQLMKVLSRQDRLTISDLQAGLYFVRLINAQGDIVYNGKIMKQ